MQTRGSVPHRTAGTREESNARSGEPIELLGHGYGTERPSRLVVDVLEHGGVSLAIHRPADRQRATAMILLEQPEGAQLLEHLSGRA